MPDVRPVVPPARPGRRGRPAPPPASPFSRLALTHAVAMMAEAFVTVALAGTLFFTVSPDSARPRVALFLVLTMAPFAVVAPVLGPLIDRPGRSGRRMFVVLTGLGRCALAVLMVRHRHSLLMFPEAFGVLVLSKGYAVAKSALVPAVVDEERTLVEANARLSLVGVLAGFVGGLPAAGILRLLGSGTVLAVAAALYGAMAVTAVRLPRATPRPAAPVDLERAELRRPTVLLSATAMAVLRAGVGFLTFFLAFALRSAGEPAWFFGAVIAASAAGGFGAAVLTPALRRKVGEEAILAGALLFPALVALFAARDPGRLFPALTALALGFGAGAGKLAFDSLVQRDAPDADRGRAFARFETRFQLAWVAGGLAPVAVPLPERVGFLGVAVGLGFAALSYVGGVRAARRASGSPAPP